MLLLGLNPGVSWLESLAHPVGTMPVAPFGVRQEFCPWPGLAWHSGGLAWLCSWGVALFLRGCDCISASTLWPDSSRTWMALTLLSPRAGQVFLLFWEHCAWSLCQRAVPAGFSAGQTNPCWGWFGQEQPCLGQGPGCEVASWEPCQPCSPACQPTHPPSFRPTADSQPSVALWHQSLPPPGARPKPCLMPCPMLPLPPWRGSPQLFAKSVLILFKSSLGEKPTSCSCWPRGWALCVVLLPCSHLNPSITSEPYFQGGRGLVPG